MLPYVLVGDDIFPLKIWLMKPSPGKSQTEIQAIYNYRLSRCRCIACVSLHNYLRLTDNGHYVPKGFID
ncbi:unnamed protein product [Porites evermanni]|uniref:DDE Tnp4 domain-containing protein n=1 Tax=Porites evermanni TaxID=104178 RepID=A0ABN8MHD0_9CNID|nr:unnamed protein product [Porites evermanni]